MSERKGCQEVITLRHISFSSLIFKEGGTYVAYCPQLDVSSCGTSVDHARRMLKEAVQLFVEEAERMGTLEQILIEAGYNSSDQDGAEEWIPPQLMAVELAEIEAGA